jgi:adenylate cyclase
MRHVAAARLRDKGVEPPQAAKGFVLSATQPTPKPEQVRRQLERVLGSPRFAPSERTHRFLRYVVEEALAGRTERLKQYSIAIEALGRDHGFDPATDPVVRLEAGKLRRALELYYLGEGAADPVRIAVPKGSYVPNFALAAAPRPGRGDIAPLREAHADLDARRLVVLPFAAQAGDPACAALAGSFVEQFTVELARYRDVTVVAAEAGPQQPVEAGLTLSARFALSGSVRAGHGRLRVTSRLHDVQSQAILWSESYDLHAAPPRLEEQDAIARSAAGAICDVYGVISHVLSVESVHAPARPWSLQDAVQRHRYLARTLTEPVYRLARRDLEIGTERAPGSAVLWAGLGHAIFYGNVLGFDDDADWMQLVHRHAQRAFELDHKNGFGHVVTALLQLYQQQFEEVFDTCERLAAAHPSAPSTQLSIGFFRALAGDWEGGTELLTRALGNLVHPPGWACRVTFLERYRRGDYARALNEAGRYHAPENFTPSVLRAAALSRLGRLDEARAAARDVLRLCPRFAAVAPRYFRYLAPFDDLAAALRGGLEPTGLLDGEGSEQ